MNNIKKNFIYNIAYQILIMILPLITTPYISRVLGTDGIGVYSYTYSIVYYFILFAMLGINNYGNRQIAKVRDDKQRLAKTFTGIYAMQIITSLIMILLYIIYLKIFVYTNKEIATIQIIYLIATMFDINWFFFGLEKFKLTVTRNIFIKLITVICIFLFVKQKGDVYLYTIIMSAGTLVSQLLLWPFVKKYTKLVKIEIKDIIKHLKPCAILFIPTIAVSLYKTMDKIMLGNMTDMHQVGLYENSEKTTNIITAVITALGTVMLPRMSNLVATGEKEKEKEYIKKSMEFTFFSSSAMAFGLMAIAPTFAPLFFGNEFNGVDNIIKYLSITTIFISVANVIRTQYIIPHEKDKIYIYSVSLGAIINIIINAIMIPKYQAIGAAIGTIFAEFSVMLYQIFCVRKEIDIVDYLKKGFSYIIAGVVMYVLVSSLYYIIKNSIVRLLVQFLVGAGVYLGISIYIYMKNSGYKNVKEIIKAYKH